MKQQPPAEFSYRQKRLIPGFRHGAFLFKTDEKRRCLMTQQALANKPAGYIPNESRKQKKRKTCKHKSTYAKKAVNGSS